MVNKTLLMSLMVWAAFGHANTNDMIRAYQAEGQRKVAEIAMAHIATLKAASMQNQLEHKSLIDTLLLSVPPGLQAQQKPKEAQGAIIFVSFSMPDSLLFALADEAAHFNIPVVINGLVDGDFKKTIETFKRLNREAKKQQLNFQGVSIDPVWFTQFQITSVPALVVTKHSKSCEVGTVCPTSSFDVVYGNASLKKGLELIAQKGDAAPAVAQKILESGHV